MVHAIIKWSLHNRLIVILGVIALIGAGIHSTLNLNIEAYPDPTPPLVEVITQNPGASPEEMERLTRVGGVFYRFTVITREIENAEDLLTFASTPSTGRKREVIARVADEMRRLHESGVYHADLTMKNILMTGTSVYIIDLDKATPELAESQTRWEATLAGSEVRWATLGEMPVSGTVQRIAPCHIMAGWRACHSRSSIIVLSAISLVRRGRTSAVRPDRGVDNDSHHPSLRARFDTGIQLGPR